MKNIKYPIIIILFICAILLNFSCNNSDDDFQLEGSFWTATWNEPTYYIVDGVEVMGESRDVYCSITFGEQNCLIEIPDEDYTVVCPYIYNKKFVVISYKNHLERIDIMSNSFVWFACPFVEGSRQNITFRRRK